MTAQDHNKVLSIFFFIVGGLQVLLGAFFILLYGGIGGAMIGTSNKTDEQTAGGFMLAMGIIFGGLFLLFALLYLITGWQTLKQKKSAKILGIIVSILSLFSFPIGTALGVYGLWFFFGEHGKFLYDGIGNNAGNYNPPPPPVDWR